MGNDCGIEVATAAITFETEATLNKKRGGLTLIYSVVVQPRCPIEIRNFVITMLESQQQQQQQQNNDMVDKRKKIFLSKGHATTTTTTTELSLNSDKTSLNSTLTKNVRVGKPNLSISYSWSDRRTAKKEKSKKSRRRRSKRRRRKRKKNKTIQDSSASETEQNTKSRKSSSKWKKMITPRRKRRQKKKKPITLKKKRPPLPLYAPNPKKIFPQNQHPVQIQFIEECPASVDLCVIFNSNTATHKFTGNTTGPFRTTGGQRRIYRASDRSCFDFSNEITRQKKHYNHCFSVEFQVEKVRYVTHFQETERVVVLWAKEINGLYHGYGYDNDDVTAQTLLNVPVLLCLPNPKLAVQQQQQQPQITSQFRRQGGGGGAELKGKMEIMDLMICDSKSTAWLKHRKVQLFPVHQIKAADIQSYMSQAQYKNNEEAQSSCSDAASLARKKKKQDHHRKKKRNRSRFWQRSRAQIKEITPVPELEVPKEPVLLGPPPGLDLIALRRITKATHPGIQGLTSVENSPREAFTLTDSTYSIYSSSSPSASISSTSSSGRISQPSAPSGETTIESFSMSNTTATTLSDGSSWFTDSQEEEEVSPYELVEEEEESSSYIQLQKDSTDRIISDSIETASATSSAASAASSSSSRHRHRRHQKKKKNHNQIPVFNLKPIIAQRESLLEGIAKKMQNEIQEIENPQTVSPRFPSYHLPRVRKISADQETTESSNVSNGYNALLSPRSEISPRLCRQHRKDIMKRAQQKKDGTTDSSMAINLKKDIDKQIKQKQRKHLVDLLNKKTAKQLDKSPRKRIKKLVKVLSSRRLPTTAAKKNRELYKELNRQTSLRNNNPFSLPHSLYASTSSLPTLAVKTGTTKIILKKDSYQ